MNQNLPEKQGKAGIIRDQYGRYVQGVSGNPGGRPKGVSITRMIREAMDSVEEHTGLTWKEIIVDAILQRAARGDPQMLKVIWAYIDGIPNLSAVIERDDPEDIIKTIMDRIEDDTVDQEVIDSKIEAET